MKDEELDALENELVTGFRGCPFPRVTTVMGTAAAAIQTLRQDLACANTALAAAYEKLDRGADFDRTIGTDFNKGAQR